MIIYISGPYSAQDKMKVIENIQHAERFALKVLELGHIPITPHLLFRLFEFKTDHPKEVFLKADVAILDRCDGILMIDGWKESEGARYEHDYALANKVPIYYHWQDVPEKAI